MKRALFLLLLLLTGFSYAQTPNWLWAESSNATGSYEWGLGIFVDTISNNLFVGGRFGGTNNLGGQNCVAGFTDNPFTGRFDESGNASWLSEYTFSNGYDYPAGYWRDKHDNTYSVGIVSSGSSLYVAKWNSAGVLQWPNTMGSSGGCNGVVADGAGCVYITGCYSGSLTLGSFTLTGNGEAIFIAKLDATGNYLWARSISGGGGDWDMGSTLTIDNSANIYVTGSYTGTPTFGAITAPTATGSNLYIAEYDSSGNALNVITAQGAGLSNITSRVSGITIDSCGYLYVNSMFSNTVQFGSISLTGSGPRDIFTAKCSNSGTWLWVNSISCGSNGGGSGSIALDKYTDVYIASLYESGSATLGSTTVSGGDMLVAKYDNGTGNLDWAQSNGSSNNADLMGGITVDNNRFVYIDGGYGTSATFGSTTITDREEVIKQFLLQN